jgi:hypothetical protein
VRFAIPPLLKVVYLFVYPSLLEQFVNRYKEMDPSTMWTLASGRIVEERLYNAVINDLPPDEADGLAVRWIISCNDTWANTLFTKEELMEIYDSRITPEASEKTVKFLASLEALREVYQCSLFHLFAVPNISS